MASVQNVPLPQSTCIEYAKYHPKSKTLRVKFKDYNKYAYNYYNVDTQLVKDWVKQSKQGYSVGKFFINHIKPVHNFTREQIPQKQILDLQDDDILP